MGISERYAEKIGHPSVSLVPGHDPIPPDLIEDSVSTDPEVSQASVSRQSKRRLCSGMYSDIGVASGIAVADVQQTVSLFVPIDF
jgi:hypothetical protein